MIASDFQRRQQASAANSKNHWTAAYARRIFWTDLLITTLVVFSTQLAWLGTDTELAGIGIEYTAVSLCFIVLWLLSLSMYGSRSSRTLGSGAYEYRAIFDASLRLFGIVAIVSMLFQIDFSRGYLLISFPVGTILLLVGRWGWRKWLGQQRRRERFLSRAVVVGSRRACNSIVEDLQRSGTAEFSVVGMCVMAHADDVDAVAAEAGVEDLPRLEKARDYVELMESVAADTLVIASNDQLSPDDISEISWHLTPGAQHLILAPSLTNIAGPRLSVRPVSGLPLIHVETPRMEAREVALKRVFDIAGSGILLVLLSPLLAVVAILVKFSSPGPVFYTQERVGKEGEPFTIHKFRSMRQDADGGLWDLLKDQGTDEKPLFKVYEDPRVTAIGRLLRKYSLDEFPQLLNVFKGEMSLVGPRPQRAHEVALYDEAAKRRLVVKPGMSGLWQVSGRSNLDWEDAIRLDLYYVENWSLTSDLAILFKTVREVVAPSGAF